MAKSKNKRVVQGRDLPEIEKAFEQLKRDLPKILGNEAENHFKDGFKFQGKQTDDSAGGWTALSPSYRRWKNRNGKKRAILTVTGDLKNDILRRKTTFARTVVSTTNIPYARIHNEGLAGKAFGKHNFTMPKREFIGKSKSLHDNLKREIEIEMDNVFKI